MIIGYARVSKADRQDTAAQIAALRAAKADKIYEEAASGGRWDRPELHAPWISFDLVMYSSSGS